MKQLTELNKTLGYQFTDQSLLDCALTHRSVGSQNNERLEFLGDAVLGMVISSELYNLFPKEKEGVLTRLRASLVRGDTLAEIAKSMNLGDYISLGSGELKSGGFRRSSILADAVEAIIGAIYLDGGIEQAKLFILNVYSERLKNCEPASILKDPKTRLQEYLQSKGAELPSYEVFSVTGKEHAQTFEVSCEIESINEKIVGQGSSRRKAEQDAAEQMLKKLKI